MRLGRQTADGAGGWTFAIWTLRLAEPGRPCTLLGRPRVRLLDADGAAMGFAYHGRVDGPRTVRPAVVSVLRHPAFAIETFRCEATRPTYSRSIRVSLPFAAGVVTGRARVALCGPADGATPRTVRVGAIGTWNLTAHATRARAQAVSMHSLFPPGPRSTWGRADLDGDGRADVVVVAPSGRVTADLGRRVVRARLDPGRLQALPDLDGDGRAEILVSSSAAGCCAAYQLSSASAEVLTLSGGQLVRLATGRDGALTFGQGRGDLWAGVACGDGSFTQVTALLDGPGRSLVTRTTYAVSGGRVMTGRVERSTSTADPARLTRSQCPGMDVRGWAPHP